MTSSFGFQDIYVNNIKLSILLVFVSHATHL